VNAVAIVGNPYGRRIGATKRREFRVEFSIKLAVERVEHGFCVGKINGYSKDADVLVQFCHDTVYIVIINRKHFRIVCSSVRNGKEVANRVLVGVLRRRPVTRMMRQRQILHQMRCPSEVDESSAIGLPWCRIRQLVEKRFL
jgi:hypothetical protein